MDVAPGLGGGDQRQATRAVPLLAVAADADRIVSAESTDSPPEGFATHNVIYPCKLRFE